MKTQSLLLAPVLFLLLNCRDVKKLPEKLSRYKTAVLEKESSIKTLLDYNSIKISELEIFLRAFKKEEILELWGKNKSNSTFKKLRTYPFCRSSGKLGPKRKEGDFQIPEGIYYINRFNEKSLFHLSLGLNYPNESDLILGDSEFPGSDIFIHGGCQTTGCIPVTDSLIKELFVISKMALAGRQSKIPVHIFPARLTKENLSLISKKFPIHISFWNDLKLIYDSFEKKKRIPPLAIMSSGKYVIKN